MTRLRVFDVAFSRGLGKMSASSNVTGTPRSYLRTLATGAALVRTLKMSQARRWRSCGHGVSARCGSCQPDVMMHAIEITGHPWSRLRLLIRTTQRKTYQWIRIPVTALASSRNGSRGVRQSRYADTAQASEPVGFKV